MCMGICAFIRPLFSPIAPPMEDLSTKYDFRVATIDDYDDVFKSALHGFILNEPHAKSLDVTPTQASPLIDWIVKKCLAEPYSMIVIEKNTGKVAGFRLYSVGHRDYSKAAPFDLNVENLSDNVQMLCNLLDLKKQIWNIEPEILRQEISFVEPSHQRKGIATHLLHLGLDFDKLKEEGFHGIQAEATSFSNQKLLIKNGYEVVARTKPEEYVRPNGSIVNFHDETTDMQLCYLSLN